MFSRVLFVAVLLAVLVGSSMSCAKVKSGQGAYRAGGGDVEFILFITSDGFRTDYVEWYDPPVIKSLIRDGVRVRDARPIFPPNTTANMAALATGAYPKTSGVAHNNQYIPELDRIVGGVRPDGTPTIATMLAHAGWRTAAVSHFVFETRGVEKEMYFDVGAYHYDDTLAPGRVADKTIELIENKSANFVAINFGSVDAVGHSYGPESQEVEDMVLAVDVAIGRIVDALKAEGIFEKTLITMNADHGMSQIESKNVSMEPAASLRQAGFEVATTGAEINEDTEIIVLKGGLRIIYFRKELSEERQQAAIDALSAIEGAMIMDKLRLRELHCHPVYSGDLFVHPLPGYTIEGAGSRGGQHGRWTEMNPVLFFHGPGFLRGAWVDRADNVDIVPTLLHLVGVPPAETVDGKVIWGALTN